MVSKKVIVSNNAGIHCRPASRIMQKVLEYSDCKLIVKSSKGETDLSSILGLISLGLEEGDELIIYAEGENAEKACAEISQLFEVNFDFPPRF